jgi:hypothetical protein
MSSKKSSRKKAVSKPEVPKPVVEDELAAIANMLFNPAGKEPYHLNDKALKNLQELVDNLDAFTGNEGTWVAAWLEYLGDKEVAEIIYGSPGDFKLIIIERFNKLKPKAPK